MNLVFVADYIRVKGGKSDDARHYAGMDAAYISQNVYLFSASAGLATVARGSVDRDALAKEMNLLPTQEIILAQSVGYRSIQK
jgi:nitroreductase